MAGQKRTKTQYKCIYFNEDTKKYDVKYNFRVYDPLTKKNKSKSKWIYNQRTIGEAKKALADMQTGKVKADSKEITLAGAFDLWKIKAQGQNYSPVTINNTEQQMRMIYQFLPEDTKIKDITEDVYYKFASDCREHGYSDESLHSINATFRKLINLVYKKKLISENILHTADNIKTKQKEDYRVISKEEFDKIDEYFGTNEFWRLGVNNYPKYRLLFNVLYYTGLRIGEAIALTYNDFEHFNYYKQGEEPMQLYIPSSERAKEDHLRGMRIRVTKAYVSDLKLTKDPKNFKKRTIPLYSSVERLFIYIRNRHQRQGGSLDDRIFDWGHSACAVMLKKACDSLELPRYTCHEFRHTFISNLIKSGVPLPVIEKVSGDTQATILKRYSHMFESDEVMVLKALDNL
ncbi:MAG TPA: site-specific integrase [Candidatus Mediterraneibacter pullicola]|uniref:Site-specific integrase n=1 Tax=Candidatus Mediterraneibacter pullicola TaxID=2838682 RepID=A0A9D2HAB0_9FIRM|nr:site-specific integrase [Candidatus Mediterraneibacter pullicola]